MDSHFWQATASNKQAGPRWARTQHLEFEAPDSPQTWVIGILTVDHKPSEFGAHTAHRLPSVARSLFKMAPIGPLGSALGQKRPKTATNDPKRGQTPLRPRTHYGPLGLFQGFQGHFAQSRMVGHRSRVTGHGSCESSMTSSSVLPKQALAILARKEATSNRQAGGPKVGPVSVYRV